MPSEILPILRWDQAYNRNGDSKLPRAVVNVLRTYMNNHSLSGWVKAETLARDTGMSVRGVRKQIAANVAAGWLEIVESGNSARATVYRLTYPKGEPQFTVQSVETVNHSSPFDGQRVNHSSRSDEEPCPTVHGNREPQFTPTTPRTSPEEKFFTTPRTMNHSSPFSELCITDLEDSDEIASCGRSLTVEEEQVTDTAVPAASQTSTVGSTAAEPEDDRPGESDPFVVSDSTVEETSGVRPEGLAPLTRPSSYGARFDDPFGEESMRQQEELAAYERARIARAEQEFLETSTAGGFRASDWD